MVFSEPLLWLYDDVYEREFKSFSGGLVEARLKMTRWGYNTYCAILTLMTYHGAKLDSVYSDGFHLYIGNERISIEKQIEDFQHLLWVYFNDVDARIYIHREIGEYGICSPNVRFEVHDQSRVRHRIWLHPSNCVTLHSDDAENNYNLLRDCVMFTTTVGIEKFCVTRGCVFKHRSNNQRVFTPCKQYAYLPHALNTDVILERISSYLDSRWVFRIAPVLDVVWSRLTE